jgi:hypothetical protein
MSNPSLNIEEEKRILEEEEIDDLSFLTDANYPLLQEFRDKCTGTYKHSQALSSIIESVSIALGLDVSFMKAAAMYHDIGKINNPKFFTENQLEEENPHDELDPWISAQIISKHVSDGVAMLVNDESFPRKLIEVISQHHGDGVIKYFYDKEEDEDKSTDKFKYQLSKPKSVEAAVLMICDHIEAKSRSLYQAGKYDPTTVIEETINNLIDEGQLDEVVMKLGDLKKIKEILAKELEGMYQKRIDYDEAKEDKPKKKKTTKKINKKGKEKEDAEESGYKENSN